MAEDCLSRTGPLRVDGPPPRAGASSGHGKWFYVASGFSFALLMFWVGLLVASIRQDSLIFGQLTWVPIMPFFAGDFKSHLDHIARVQALGINPYYVPSDIFCALYPYPPMIARCFAWVTLTDKQTAAAIWAGALGLFMVTACLAARRTRRRLGLDTIPFTLTLAGVLFCTPFVYALERGQCDPMVIPPMILVAWLLGRRGEWAELAAGLLLGLTAWIKYYPGLSVVALIALGRKKALVTFVVAVALVGIFDFDGVRQSIRQGKIVEGIVMRNNQDVHVSSHSLIEAWRKTRFIGGTPILGQVPPTIPAAILLLVPILLVSRKVARASDVGPLVFPFMLWLTAAATFALPYSNDYNLFFLPIAMFTLWDRRDRLVLQLALLVSLVWLQPFRLPISGEFLIYFKIASLYATGACLAARASGRSMPEESKVKTSLYRSAFARLGRSIPTADPGSQ